MERRAESWITKLPGKVGRLLLTAPLLAASCPINKEYVVTTTSDFSDSNPGDGICAGSSSLCSLRAAVEETNAHPPGEGVRIVVPAGTYELNGELSISHDNVVIRGDDRDTTIIRQIGQGRVFTITDPGNIIIERVTLTGGNLPSGAAGGAVSVQGDAFYRVTLSQCRISENTAGFLGGGVYAAGDDGLLNVLNCVVAENDSTGQGCTNGGGQSGGGGMMLHGPTLTLLQSEIRDNCGSNGGGVRIQGGLNHLIVRSTIGGNGSATRAGGLYVHGGARGRIEDSTIAENSGPEAGGALFVGGQFEIESTTIADNTSANTSDASAGVGGLLSTDGAQVSLTNTVVAGNTGAFQLPDCSGQFFSGGGNFIGDHEAACTIAAQPTDVLDGGDPGLLPLAQGLGPTRTMLPTFNSPLVNAGVPGCGPIDQRGRPAPVGAACDIGSVERQ